MIRRQVFFWKLQSQSQIPTLTRPWGLSWILEAPASDLNAMSKSFSISATWPPASDDVDVHVHDVNVHDVDVHVDVHVGDGDD